MKPRDRLFYGWVVVGVGFLAYALAAGIYLAFGVFFKPMAAEFGWSRATTAAAFSLSGVVMGLTSPLIGMVVDRYDTRLVALTGGTLVGLGYGLLSVASALWQVFLLFPVLGVGVEIILICVLAPVNRWFVEKRGLAQGLVGAGSGIGVMAFPLLGSFFILNFGWRQAYLILGLLTGLLLMATAPWLRKEPRELGLAPYGQERGQEKLGSVPSKEQTFSFAQALATLTFWKVFLLAWLAVLSYMFIMVHLVPYATDRGTSPMAAASLLSLFGGANIVGRVAWGAIADRIGRKLALVISLALSALLFLWLLVAGEIWGLMLFALVFGLVQGGWIPNWIALQAELFGLGAIGAMVGAMEAALNLGGAVGGYLAGYIFDLTGSYSWAFLMGAFSLFLASALALSLTPPRRRL